MKQKIKSGDEYDWLYWRKVMNFPPGFGKKIKRALNKRFRRESKQEIKGEL